MSLHSSKAMHVRLVLHACEMRLALPTAVAAAAAAAATTTIL